VITFLYSYHLVTTPTLSAFQPRLFSVLCKFGHKKINFIPVSPPKWYHRGRSVPPSDATDFFIGSEADVDSFMDSLTVFVPPLPFCKNGLRMGDVCIDLILEGIFADGGRCFSVMQRRPIANRSLPECSYSLAAPSPLGYLVRTCRNTLRIRFQFECHLIP